MSLRWLAYTTLLFTATGFPSLPSDSALDLVTVSGTITDDAGASLPKATVMFKAKKIERKTVAADDGHYEIELPIGMYDVIATLHGCKDFRLKAWNAQSKIPSTLNMSLRCPPTPILLKADYGPQVQKASFRKTSRELA